MKTRSESIAYWNSLPNKAELVAIMKNDKNPGYRANCHHWGLVEIRALFDFIYEGPPLNDTERLENRFK